MGRLRSVCVLSGMQGVTLEAGTDVRITASEVIGATRAKFGRPDSEIPWPAGPLNAVYAAQKRIWEQDPTWLCDQIVVETIIPEGGADMTVMANVLEAMLRELFGPIASVVPRVIANGRQRWAGPRHLVGASMGECVDLRPQDGEIVVADSLLGHQNPRDILRMLAAETRTPLVSARDPYDPHWEFEAPRETGSYLGQIAIGLQDGLDETAKAMIQPHLVSGQKPTRAAIDYLDHRRWTVTGAYSTVADLLRSNPTAINLGDRLDRLISLWTEQRIFDGSWVTEMVLHDQSHAVSVDRHVAIVAAWLWRRGKISEHDVFLLGCAAWLHDCGHSSALIETLNLKTVPTEPGFVRSFHGALTGQRIKDLYDVMDLSADEANWIAVMTAFHQGWTGLGIDSLDGPKVSASEKALASELTRSLGAAVDNPPILKDKKGTPTQKVDYAKILSLISVLRVCDALDVGRHRVQHQDLHYAQLANTVFVYTQRCMDAIGRAPRTAELVADVIRFRDLVVREIKAGNSEIPDPIVAVLDSADHLTQDLDDVERRSIREWVDRLISYCHYITAQSEHFEKHAAVNTVLPIIAKDGRATIWVLPAKVAKEIEQEKQDEHARSTVAADFARELGVLPDDAPVTVDLDQQKGRLRQFQGKRPVREALMDLGLVWHQNHQMTARVEVPTWWTTWREDRRAKTPGPQHKQ